MKFAIGSAQFGLKYGISNQSGQVSLAEARRILNKAAEYGIDTIDTAIGYGESENVLGKIGVKNWKVISKLPEIPVGILNVKEWIYDQVTNSLSRLEVESLYALLLHRPNQLRTEIGAFIYQSLEQLKSDGLVQKIGVSIYSPDELLHLLKEMKFDLVQSPFNILDRRLLIQGWLGKLKSWGIELHVRSIFLQGLLLMQKDKRPQGFCRWNSIFDEWDSWLKNNNLTPLEACVRYAFSVKEIDKIVIGIDSLEQLCEILSAKNNKLEKLPSWPQEIDSKLINPAFWSEL